MPGIRPDDAYILSEPFNPLHRFLHSDDPLWCHHKVVSGRSLEKEPPDLHEVWDDAITSSAPVGPCADSPAASTAGPLPGTSSTSAPQSVQNFDPALSIAPQSWQKGIPVFSNPYRDIHPTDHNPAVPAPSHPLGIMFSDNRDNEGQGIVTPYPGQNHRDYVPGAPQLSL